MLASIADNELATISNELANEDKEDITEKSTLSELPIMPFEEVLPVIVPETETVAINGDDVSVGDEKAVLEEEKLLPVDNTNQYSKTFAIDVEAVTESKGITKERVTELLHKHNLTFTGAVKNTELLLPFLSELNQLHGKAMKITKNNLSKVAKKEDKNYLFPPALWECLSVEKQGTATNSPYIWTIK